MSISEGLGSKQPSLSKDPTAKLISKEETSMDLIVLLKYVLFKRTKSMQIGFNNIKIRNNVPCYFLRKIRVQ